MLTIIDPRWEAFLKVAQFGSFTRAAVAIGCLQSVLSRQITLLESQCGERLFRRTGRGVVLTDFGEQVYARVRPLVDHVGQVEDDIRTLGGEAIGEVRVGLLPSTVKPFAGRLFRALRSKHPKVVLHFTDGASAHLEEWVKEGRLDLSLLLREDMVELPDQPTLAHIKLVLIGPPGDPRMDVESFRFADLQELPLIVPAQPHLLRERLDRMAGEQGLTLTICMEADSVQLQQEMVAAGAGYSIVAETTAQADVQAGLIVARPIVQPCLARRIVLGSSPRRPSTLATREVARLMFEMRDTLSSST
jgi:LysR family nitrogen assimilation transcriptional regulator